MTVGRYFDAHNHLHDARLDAVRPTLLQMPPVAAAVVNGTRESDWPAVARLAEQAPWVIPSFGLHPWHVSTRSAEWLSHLRAYLDANPGSGIGEIGLDAWVDKGNLREQIGCFESQLALAKERNLPASIHCLRAWPELRHRLHPATMPARGCLLHAWSGPVKLALDFAAEGALFSFSPYFLHEHKAPQRTLFSRLPAACLLVETDAPDMAPPESRAIQPLFAHDGTSINHPANIATAYAALAELRGISMEELYQLVSANFARFFLRSLNQR